MTPRPLKDLTKEVMGTVASSSQSDRRVSEALTEKENLERQLKLLDGKLQGIKRDIVLEDELTTSMLVYLQRNRFTDISDLISALEPARDCDSQRLYAVLGRYLPILEEAGFIKFMSGTIILTEQGQKFKYDGRFEQNVDKLGKIRLPQTKDEYEPPLRPKSGGSE